MKKIICYLLMLFCGMFGVSHDLKAGQPSLPILEALEIALNHVPEGKSVEAIYLVRNQREADHYLAIYGNEIVGYVVEEMGLDSKFAEKTKHRKVRVGVKVTMSREVEAGMCGSLRRIVRSQPVSRSN